MGPMPRRYLLFVLDGEAAETVQGLRRQWDPVMAERIDAHLTLVYPQEFDDEELLLERAAAAASNTAPFEVRPGTVERSNLGGVWARVLDDSGAWAELRSSILTPPFRPYPVTPHITIVHPRTSDRSREALASLNGARIWQPLRVEELLFTETGKGGTRVLDRFPLTASLE